MTDQPIENVDATDLPDDPDTSGIVVAPRPDLSGVQDDEGDIG